MVNKNIKYTNEGLPIVRKSTIEVFEREIKRGGLNEIVFMQEFLINVFENKRLMDYISKKAGEIGFDKGGSHFGLGAYYMYKLLKNQGEIYNLEDSVKNKT